MPDSSLLNNGASNANKLSGEAASGLSDPTQGLSGKVPGSSAVSSVSGKASGMSNAASTKMGDLGGKLPQLPEIDPSKLPEQFPGGFGDSAAKASALADKMNNMDPSKITPEMNKELGDHLDMIKETSDKVKNPLGEHIAAAQAEIDKLKVNPNDQEAISALQTKASDLQSKTCSLYCNDQSAKDAAFPTDATASVKSSADTAKQRAANSLQQSVSSAQQKASSLSDNMLSQVDVSSVDGFKSSAQQAMMTQAQQQVPDEVQNMSEQQLSQQFSQGVATKLSAQYPSNPSLVSDAQGAIQNSGQVKDYIQNVQIADTGSSSLPQLQNSLPQTPAMPTMPQNPCDNLTATVQNIQLPQGSPLTDKLAATQQSVQGLSANPIQNQAQQVSALKDQFSQLPAPTQAQVGDTNPFESPEACISENITANASEPPEPNQFVVNGATWVCTFGGTGAVQVPPGGSEVDGQGKAQPLTAIFTPGGLCNNPAFPGVIKPVVGLVPEACACMPVAPAWAATTVGKVTGNGDAFLTAASKGQCMPGAGGALSIVVAGQMKAKVSG